MEVVEGPRLADRIQQGAIPLEEALGIAKQIAEALEAAHDKNCSAAILMATIAGAVDLAHPACSDNGDDLVWAEAGANGQRHDFRRFYNRPTPTF